MKNKTIKKSLLKEGYYYEEKDWYNGLPEKLTIPSYQEEIFPQDMTSSEILDTYHIVPYTIEQAFAVAADKSQSLKNGEYRLVYFMDGDNRYRLSVCRDSDGELGVDVSKVDPDDQWNAGYGVLFSNETKTLSTPDTLSLENFDPSLPTQVAAIKYLKECGFKITREETKIIEY